jgi:arginyl-tRNA synthetase
MKDIKEIIAEELKKVGVEATSGDLEHPKNLANGDFAFFVKNKEVVLEKLPLEKISHEYLEKVSIFARFINFTLSKKYFTDVLARVIETGDTFGHNQNLAGKNIIIEYTDPNPFKVFHIGHLMSNSIGESLARLVASSGATVTRANYQGDVGPHVAKVIWGMMKLKKEQPKDSELVTAKTAFLGKAYVFGASEYEENAEAKKEIDAINKKIYEKTDTEINRLYSWGREASLAHFEEIYKKLGTKFNLYFFESETAPVGLFAVEELLGKGILEKSDGAVVFKGEQYGLHTRVFINSQGLPTYETKELGLSKMKFDRQDYDQSIVITASEQTDYFHVLLKVLEFYDHRVANRTRHVPHGMMRFAEGKMSSRKGNVITGESLLADVEKLVQEKMADRDLSAEEKAEVAEQVSVGAIKYSILKQSPGKDIIFDFEKSLSFEGDSGPYLQYTHARICSVLAKAVEENISPSLDQVEDAGDLERLLARFPTVVERAQKEFTPQLITTYLTNLASAFNSYYAGNKIIDAGNAEVSAYRLALAQAVKTVLQNGLFLLGIKAPVRM